MEALAALWKPILLAAIVMFIASAIAWMLLPHHGKEWQKVPSLTLWFLNLLYISALAGYLLYNAVVSETEYLEIFRVAGTALLLGHTGALFARAIFWGFRWRSIVIEFVEGGVYSLLAAGVFGWWWLR
ncbi:MAG: hypothetical protein ACT443_11580 [Gemmatimonadota bacterium]